MAITQRKHTYISSTGDLKLRQKPLKWQLSHFSAELVLWVLTSSSCRLPALLRWRRLLRGVPPNRQRLRLQRCSEPQGIGPDLLLISGHLPAGWHWPGWQCTQRAPSPRREALPGTERGPDRVGCLGHQCWMLHRADGQSDSVGAYTEKHGQGLQLQAATGLFREKNAGETPTLQLLQPAAPLAARAQRDSGRLSVRRGLHPASHDISRFVSRTCLQRAAEHSHRWVSEHFCTSCIQPSRGWERQVWGAKAECP